MASIYVAPGVYDKETDLSDIIANISSTSAGIVINSRMGDIRQPRLTTSTQKFIDMFGIPKPEDLAAQSAIQFLKQGKVLWVARAVKSALYGGVAIMPDGDGQSNEVMTGVSTAEFASRQGKDDLIQIYAKDPGLWNNKIGIKIANVDETEYTFDILVYVQNDAGNYQLMETWTVSRKTKLDGYGRQLYLETRINEFSKYILVYDNTGSADTVLPKEQSTTLPISTGSDGSEVTSGEIETAWDMFANPNKIDIRMLINGGFTADSAAVQNKMVEIAEARKDCIAICDIDYAALASVDAMVAWRQGTQNINSNYAALYGGWGKIYDQYNDVMLEIPASGLAAAIYAYSDYASNFWYAPAGFNRGVMKILGVTNVFEQGDLETLYAAQINPLQTFIGRGNVIWGQKTLQTKASSLDRVNVRRELIIIEKALSAAAQYFVFEPNNDPTRFRLWAQCVSYLDQLSHQGAFQTELGDKGYKAVCDETNNTPDVIGRHELHLDLFIKPSMAAEYIILNTIITATGASFDELIAQGVNL